MREPWDANPITDRKARARWAKLIDDTDHLVTGRHEVVSRSQIALGKMEVRPNRLRTHVP